MKISMEAVLSSVEQKRREMILTEYYSEKNITIYCGDCLEVMKDIPDKSIDMVLCDPPYGTTACKWDTIIPLEPLWEQYKRIIKDNGAIVLTASQPFTSLLVCSNLKMFKYEWIWDKIIGTGFISANFRPLKRHENILVFSRGNNVFSPKGNYIKYNPQKTLRDKPIKGYAVRGEQIDRNFDKQERIYLDKHPTSIVVYKKIKKTIHPTQKPVALFEYLIKTYTNEGDLVLDNCAGSGTTAVACKELGRKCIGIEISEKYCEITKKRLRQNYFLL